MAIRVRNCKHCPFYSKAMISRCKAAQTPGRVLPQGIDSIIPASIPSWCPLRQGNRTITVELE